MPKNKVFREYMIIKISINNLQKIKAQKDNNLEEREDHKI
jgi:hypothetical protein